MKVILEIQWALNYISTFLLKECLSRVKKITGKKKDVGEFNILERNMIDKLK